MVNNLSVKLMVGTVLGFLSGLGVGGGSLLLLWLTLVVGMAPEAARTVNLIFFLPSALVACAIRLKKGSLKIVPLLPAIVSGCIAAAVFSLLAGIMDQGILKKLFGILLILAGIREICYRPRKFR